MTDKTLAAIMTIALTIVGCTYAYYCGMNNDKFVLNSKEFHCSKRAYVSGVTDECIEYKKTIVEGNK